MKTVDKILQIFVKNQLYLNPNYDGEILVYKGAKVDTGPIVQELRKTFNWTSGDGDLELVMSFYSSTESIYLRMGENVVSLRDYIKSTKKQLMVTYKAKDFLDSFASNFHKMALNSYAKANQEMGTGVFLDNLLIDDFTEDLSKQALKNLFGVTDTRFILTRTKGRMNGNLLDLVDDDFKRVCKVSQPFTTPANMIRAHDLPYSDYRKFISFGVLVSVDSNDNVYMLRDDIMYCMSVSRFSAYLDKPSEFDNWKNQFSPVFVADELAVDKKIDWSLLR